MGDFATDIVKDIVKKLKTEIKTTPIEKLGDTMLNIILKGKEFGLTENDMGELRDTFKKRLKEI
jgi:uncharacterized protein YpuA (DUF1002 family)